MFGSAEGTHREKQVLDERVLAATGKLSGLAREDVIFKEVYNSITRMICYGVNAKTEIEGSNVTDFSKVWFHIRSLCVNVHLPALKRRKPDATLGTAPNVFVAGIGPHPQSSGGASSVSSSNGEPPVPEECISTMVLDLHRKT